MLCQSIEKLFWPSQSIGELSQSIGRVLINYLNKKIQNINDLEQLYIQTFLFGLSNQLKLN